jgi:2-dehydro-3-deoxy-D-gluconate 5-dehydrogenase
VKRFEKKVVIVTGSSRGIGQAIAVAFAREGATVLGIARSDQGETTARARAVGGEFIPLAMDAGRGTQKDAADVVAKVLERAGQIDVLVNNAGIIRRAPAVEFSEADWNDVLRTNLSTPFFLCQAAAKWWLAGARAQSPAGARLKIVNIASLLSYQGGILVSAYVASKHGIAGITRALANEWAKEQINVNAIAPGYIATENTRALREDAARNRAILERIPENRWGTPEDIAGSCLFLASSDADYLNGTVLNVDGGWLGR